MRLPRLKEKKMPPDFSPLNLFFFQCLFVASGHWALLIIPQLPDFPGPKSFLLRYRLVLTEYWKRLKEIFWNKVISTISQNDKNDKNLFWSLPECDEVELVLVAPPDLTRLLQQQQHNVSSKISPNRMPPAAAPIIIATLDSWVSFLPPGNPTYKKERKEGIMSH